MFKLILLLIFVGYVFGQNRVRVTIPQGSLEGVRTSTGIFRRRYLAFRGIPYAEPPIGPLRFHNPVPHHGWNGTLDASNYRAACPHRAVLGITIPNSDEDCLFLNVYTPNVNGNRAVMVWIHPGTFVFGDGSSRIFGPDLFINDGDVVYVSFNYRLGILGFLSTNDTASPGNYAMKDMVEALKWIKNNIRQFGGNPNSVTIFGVSAGAISAHYLTLSQMAAGLFHRAIIQSGTAMNPWAFQSDPASEAYSLGRRLNLVWSSSQDLIDQLRNVPYRDILAAQRGIMRGIPYAPNVEPADSSEPRFLIDTPLNLMTRGEINKVPMIIGYTSNECLYTIRLSQINRSVFEQFRTNPHLYIPPSFNLHPSTNAKEIDEVAAKFRDIYFDGAFPNAEIRYNWSVFNTDLEFTFSTDRTVRYHAMRQTEPIFYYTFRYDGSLNILKRSLGLGSYPGAMHGEDVFYLFDVSNLPMPILPNDQAILIRRRMIRMWTNFAKFGHPTPVTDQLITTHWHRYTLAGEDYLDIENGIVNKNIPMNGRLHTWHEFQDRFNPTVVD